MESCANHLCVEERNQTFRGVERNSNLYHADAGIASRSRRRGRCATTAHPRPRTRSLPGRRPLQLTATSKSSGGLGVEQHDADRGSSRPAMSTQPPKCSWLLRQPARPVPLCNRCNTFEQRDIGGRGSRASRRWPSAISAPWPGQAESGDVRAGVDLRGRERSRARSAAARFSVRIDWIAGSAAAGSIRSNFKAVARMPVPERLREKEDVAGPRAGVGQDAIRIDRAGHGVAELDLRVLHRVAAEQRDARRGAAARTRPGRFARSCRARGLPSGIPQSRAPSAAGRPSRTRRSARSPPRSRRR